MKKTKNMYSLLLLRFIKEQKRGLYGKLRQNPISRYDFGSRSAIKTVAFVENDHFARKFIGFNDCVSPWKFMNDFWYFRSTQFEVLRRNWVNFLAFDSPIISVIITSLQKAFEKEHATEEYTKMFLPKKYPSLKFYMRSLMLTHPTDFYPHVRARLKTVATKLKLGEDGQMMARNICNDLMLLVKKSYYEE